MNKNGFTMVELIAVFVILGLLMLVVFPNVLNSYNGIQINNYLDKIDVLEANAEKYANGNSYVKNNIKNATSDISIKTLIKEGLVVNESTNVNSSDENEKYIIYNPITDMPMAGAIKLVYSYEDYNVHAYYYLNFESVNTTYYKGQNIFYNDHMYKLNKIWYGDGKVSGTPETNTEYFKLLF